MAKPRRSPCPIAFSLDLFGDRWTLLILRDMVFGYKHHYREFLQGGEGISTNILADRLDRLVEGGLVQKAEDPDDRKQFRYTLTEKGLDLIPLLLEMIAWGGRHDPATGAPEEYVERIRTDREAVIEEIRDRHRPG